MNDHSMDEATLEIESGPTSADGSAVLVLVGPLDQDAAPKLSDELERRLEAGATRLYLQMQRVTFLSSAGVGSLIASIGAYRDQGGDVILRDVPAGILHVLDLLCLQDYVTLEDAPKV